MLRIGTSGWIYRHWRGVFYPEKLPQRAWLEFYARHFDAVEINFTFYRLPARGTFESWRKRATPGFVYVVKGSRYITHIKRLKEPAEHVGLFFERFSALGDRAGPVLWQLPPDFRRDDTVLEGFLEVLPRHYQHAMEFRHESWLVEPVFDALSRHSVALCIPDHPRLPKSVRLTTDWTYLRFHYGDADGNYTSEELDHWTGVIRALQDGARTVWAFFNNDWKGYAIQNALDLRSRLETSLPPNGAGAVPDEQSSEAVQPLQRPT